MAHPFGKRTALILQQNVTFSDSKTLYVTFFKNVLAVNG